MTLMMLFQAAVVAATLQGKVVVWGSTTPLAQVEVELRRIDNTNALPITAVTSAQGDFGFLNVPPGSYRLIAMRQGFTQGEYQQRRPGDVGSPITLTAGQPTTNVTLGMARGGTITGKTIDRDGMPMPRVLVNAERVTYVDGRPKLTTVQSTVTNDLGEYRLFWLAPGRYYVSFRTNMLGQGIFPAIPNAPDNIFGLYPVLRAPLGLRGLRPSAEDRETYLTVYFPGATDFQSATMIDLHAGEEIRNVSAHAIVGKTLSLRVTAIDANTGQVVEDPGIIVQPLNSPPQPMIMRIINGALAFQVVPGVYEIRTVFTRPSAGRLIVEVRDRDLNVALPLTSFTVSGKVHVENGPAAFQFEKHQVALRAEPSYRVTATIASDGTFRIENVPTGDYQVVVSDEALRDMYVTSMRMGDNDLLDRPVRIASQPQEMLDISLMGGGGELSGVVVDGRQQGISQATVVLVPNLITSIPRWDLYKSTTSDSSGRFQFHALAPGDYSVYAWEDVDSGAWLDPNFMRSFRTAGAAIHVSNSEKLNARIQVIP